MSSNGLDSSQTMKLFGQIGRYKVLVMVDSGTSHCFISEQLATSLALQVTPTIPYSVTLGDGSRIRAVGICRDVALALESEVFTVSCNMFPLRNIDVILEVSWLASLGDVTANWNDLSMKFVLQGRLVALRGDPYLTRRACSARDIRALDVSDSCWVLRSMVSSNSTDQFELGDALSEAEQQQLRELTERFPAVVKAPISLPPVRKVDHRIPLQQGSSPVSVRPYRYNHLQKDEMEKLVAEMLASGVIQPSTSPYSSPDLLVRKKDGSWRFCVDYRELMSRPPSRVYKFE